MRIVVLSDSHGAVAPAEAAIAAQPDAEAVIFLGDGLRQFEDIPPLFPEKAFYMVAGNCDWGGSYKNSDQITLAGKKIFFTHGHTCCVKYGLGYLMQSARAAGADIVLYGHTHVAGEFYENGIYVMNPGSISQSRDGKNSYGIIDITPAGIVTGIIHV